MVEGIFLEIENFIVYEFVDVCFVFINIGMSKVGSRYLVLFDYDDMIYFEVYKYLILEFDCLNFVIVFGGIVVKYVMICEDVVLVLLKW